MSQEISVLAPTTGPGDAEPLAISSAPSTTWSDGWRRRLKAMKRLKALAERNPASWTEARAEKLLANWRLWASEPQRAPTGDWRVWMFMGGRGAGKTRAGSEWVRGEVEAKRASRIALVGPSLADVREVMIEGPSGLRWVGRPDRRPHYEVSRRRLVWPCGAIAYAFSAEDPDSLRGPQFDLAWCDEVGAWARGEAVWDTLAFALRLGERPRIAVTTTPRRTGLIRRLVKLGERGALVRTKAASRENAAFLSPKFVTELEALYAGTSIARMELEGEFTDERPGALFAEKMFEDNRVEPEDGLGCERVVVAVDPPASIGPRAAWCGIIAAGLKNEKVYVLQDGSVKNATPLRWAQCVIAVAEAHGAGRVVAESNQGGEMVGQIIRIASDDRHRVDMRHASKSKYARAEPVSAWIGAGRVKFAGVFPELEAEMCAFGESHLSPDRMDALVWAVSELFGERKLPPKVTSF